MVTKLKSLHLKSLKKFKKSKNFKISEKIAEKPPMLKQGVKQLTLNLFKHVHYPNFLLFSSDFTQPRSWGFFST